MCYAVPGLVVRTQGDTARIDYGGVERDANISLVRARRGDYVLVHAGFAIQKLDPAYAREALRLIESG